MEYLHLGKFKEHTAMIVDCHSHLMWSPDHLSPEFRADAALAWQANMGLTTATLGKDMPDQELFDARPEKHWAASAKADKVIVFGMQAPATGIDVPNEVIADYARLHPEKIEGWASVDPNRPDCVEYLEHCVSNLGLKGLKLAPAYQVFDPMDSRHYPLYRKCEMLGLPILWHQGTTFPQKARIRWSLPLQLEDIALQFPDLKMILAHLGHPWEADTIVLIRKAHNLYSDISAIHFRSWRYWQSLVTALEYGVGHKILFGTDFPFDTVEGTIDGLRQVNDLVEGTRLPRVPKEMQDMIIYENWKRFFTHWA